MLCSPKSGTQYGKVIERLRVVFHFNSLAWIPFSALRRGDKIPTVCAALGKVGESTLLIAGGGGGEESVASEGRVIIVSFE